MEELLKALYGAQERKSKSNPYLLSEQIVGNLGYQPSARQQRSGKPDWKSQAMFALAQGLAGGILGGLGERRQQRENQDMSNRLVSALGSASPASALAADEDFASLAPTLAFDDYRQNRQLSNKRQDMDLALEYNLRGKGIIPGKEEGQYIADPQMISAQREVARAEKGLPPLPTMQGSQTMPENSIAQPSMFGQKVPSVEEKLQMHFQNLLNQGMDHENAAKRAAELVKGERDATSKSFTKIDEARKKAQQLKELADTAEAGMETAGYTGPLNPIRSAGAHLGALLGSQEQAQKLQGQGLLDSIRPEVIKASRSPGAVSDYESKLYLSAGPHSGNRPEHNEALISKMRELSGLEAEYANFLEAYVNEKGTANGAENLWQQYTRQFPLFQQTGTGITLNKGRPSWQDFFSQGGATTQAPQATAGSFEGVMGGRRVMVGPDGTVVQDLGPAN